MMQEPEIKRWTAKRKAELIRQIYKGQTSIEEAARESGAIHACAARTYRSRSAWR
jgi:transposase-like protein